MVRSGPWSSLWIGRGMVTPSSAGTLRHLAVSNAQSPQKALTLVIKGKNALRQEASSSQWGLVLICHFHGGTRGSSAQPHIWAVSRRRLDH